MTAAKHDADGVIVKVEATDDPRWVVVTVRDRDGDEHLIKVRQGSHFAERPRANA